MKASEAHNLKDDELLERIHQTREETFSLRFRHATGELENTAGLRESRRAVARLMTIVRERGIDISKELR